MLIPCRSAPPFPPTSLWAKIDIRIPSGNIWANIVISQSGKKRATGRRNPAASTSSRARAERTRSSHSVRAVRPRIREAGSPDYSDSATGVPALVGFTSR